MKFDVIECDPPWPSPEKDEKTGKTWGYPTVLPDEVLSWDVGSLAKDGTHLWLWTTQTHLPLAIKCLDAWQFRYQVCIPAIKPSGFGNWWAKHCQFLLFAFRSPLDMSRKCQKDFFYFKPERHSAKPEEGRKLIQTVSGDVHRKTGVLKHRVELFARAKRPGWLTLGNEVTGNDIVTDIMKYIKKKQPEPVTP